MMKVSHTAGKDEHGTCNTLRPNTYTMYTIHLVDLVLIFGKHQNLNKLYDMMIDVPK